jgi:hypothetical protein
MTLGKHLFSESRFFRDPRIQVPWEIQEKSSKILILATFRWKQRDYIQKISYSYAVILSDLPFITLSSS